MSVVGRKCSACLRPCAGHPGCKYGPSCTNVRLTEQEQRLLYGESSRDTQSQTSQDKISSPQAEVYGTPSTSAGWLPAPTVQMDSNTNSIATTPPIQSIAATSATSAPGVPSATDQLQPDAGQTAATQAGHLVTQTVHHTVASTGGATTTVVTINAAGQIPSIQVTSFISPVNVVNSMTRSQATMSHYAPTWSTMAPQMSVGAPPPTLPTVDSQTGLVNELSILKQHMARLEVVIAAQTRDTVGTAPTNWYTGIGTGNVQYQPSPAMAGPATGAGTASTQYSCMTFGYPQGVLPNTSLVQPLQPCQPRQPSPVFGVHSTQQPLPTQQQYTPEQGPAVQQPPQLHGLRPLGELGDLTRYMPFPGMPDRIARNALAGMFVSLDDFLNTKPSDNPNEGQLIMDAATNQVTYKPSSAVRKVKDFTTWLEAYLNYMRLMVNANGLQAYYLMSDYIPFIQKNDSRFYWYAIDAFDVAHRQWLSGKSLAMTNIDPIIVAANLVSSAAKHEVRCTRCRSPDHATADCPTVVAVPPSGRRNRSSSRGKRSDEICKNFNITKCTFQGCKRMHKCAVCKGDLPVKECTQRGPCAE